MRREERDPQRQCRRLDAIEDNRVHLMLFFFGNGHHTNVAEFTMLKRFQPIVNILPVIAKGDSFTSTELYKLKLEIINYAAERNFQFFDCF